MCPRQGREGRPLGAAGPTAFHVFHFPFLTVCVARCSTPARQGLVCLASPRSAAGLRWPPCIERRPLLEKLRLFGKMHDWLNARSPAKHSFRRSLEVRRPSLCDHLRVTKLYAMSVLIAFSVALCADSLTIQQNIHQLTFGNVDRTGWANPAYISKSTLFLMQHLLQIS